MTKAEKLALAERSMTEANELLRDPTPKNLADVLARVRRTLALVREVRKATVA